MRVMSGAREGSPDPAAGERSAVRLELSVCCEAPDESLLEVRGPCPAALGEIFAEEIRPLDLLLWEGIPPEDVPERTTGEEFLSRAVPRDGGWIAGAALRGLPREVPEGILEAVRADLEHLKVSLPDEVFLFRVEEGVWRIVFTWREHLLRAVRFLLHRHVASLAGPPLTLPNLGVCEDLVRRADGRGPVFSGGDDLTDKGRTIEVTLHPAPFRGEVWTLYHDRTTGLWALSG